MVVFAALLIANEQVLRKLVLGYLFPQSWHAITDTLVDFFFESQAKLVLGSAILSGSIVAVSILLFPLKERVSATFERDAQLKTDQSDEFSLLYQGWEEVKLFFIYVTAQLTILWIGYYPYTWTTYLSIALGVLFLFFSFGLDLISPTLQRHRISYSLILKLLCKNPLVTLLFGAVFTLPSLGLSHIVLSLESLTLVEMSVILFFTNIVFLSLAIPAGTIIAAQLFPEAKTTVAPSFTNKAKAYGLMGFLLCINLILHSRLYLSMHHKSQFLKCEYDIHWGSMDFKFAPWQKSRW